MIRDMVLTIALVVVGLLLSSSTALAVDCEADVDCSGYVGLNDLVKMKDEWMEMNCERSTKCGRCNWPCSDPGGEGQCVLELMFGGGHDLLGRFTGFGPAIGGDDETHTAAGHSAQHPEAPEVAAEGLAAAFDEGFGV